MGTTLKLTAKGQITLKKELLQHLGVGIGELLEVEKLPDGGLKIRAGETENRHGIMNMAGCLQGKSSVRLSIEEINEAIAESYAQAGMRGLGRE
ncbi:hypothetical protein AABM17_492 [Neisseria musculi]|uniref:SpoVT-AbrB domain-containing protein n=2 Tax=Neisseria musculi TaxID=1815583 RepID=A0A7H1MCW8_9NEIS|nr:hypothetical protein H7A79_0492 [Neisseria musculi]